MPNTAMHGAHLRCDALPNVRHRILKNAVLSTTLAQNLLHNVMKAQD